jgi:glyoxylase-like metal-dependent hydrolase (beta-lactamase superfamily II)
MLCTHLHIDHVGWNTMKVDGKWVPTFPNARYLFARDEFNFWRDEDAQKSAAHSLYELQLPVIADSVMPVFDAGLVELVDTGHRVCDEISLTPTLGHTPGHVSIKISSRGEEALITGDCIHHPCQMAHPDWSAHVDFDPTRSAKTRYELFSGLAGTPTLVIGTHFATPTAGRLVRDGDGFRLVV